MDLHDSLQKVRSHRASQIPSQVRQAQLLEAVEEMLREESANPPSTAYFAALLSLLERADAAPSAVSLLAHVVPHVPKSLLAQKIDVVVAKLLPLLLDADADTAVVRSTIGVLEALLVSIDGPAWQVPAEQLGALRVFTGVLGLAQDGRPKIRKRAAEAVQTVLQEGQVSRQASILAFESAIAACEQSDNKQLHHGLQLLRAVITALPVPLPASSIERLVGALLQLARGSDAQLVLATLAAFDTLFTAQSQSEATDACVQALLGLSPAPEDRQLTPAWLAALAQAARSVSIDRALEVFAEVSRYLASPPAAPEVAESAGQCLIAFVAGTVPRILESEQREVALNELADKYLLPLLQVQFHGSWAVVCELCAAFIACLPRDVAPRIAAALSTVRVIGALRGSQSERELDAGADAVLSAAIRVLGPRLVCDELVPLQLDPASGRGRVWLLPLLAENVEATELAYFFERFVPLGDEFAAAARDSVTPNRTKVLETVSFQLLQLFARFCDQCTDANSALDTARLELVLTWLYQRPELRASVCQGIKLLVQTSPGGEEFASQHGADVLRALLNTYQAMTADNRAFVLDTADAVLALLPEDEVTRLFAQLCALLEQEIEDSAKRHALMDIANVIVPYAEQTAAVPLLLQIAARTGAMDDAAMQKKAYRALTTIEDPQGVLLELMQLLVDLQPQTAPQARRTRLAALSMVVSAIPESNADFGFVFHILPEAILATKDMNEKTRAAAFELLVLCGRKMQASSGVVDHSQIASIGDDLKPAATVTEYFEMVMAGLAGATPHMVAATATALSRVFYEFASELPAEKLEEYVDVVWMLLESTNREIVAATLGFVKVSILVISPDTLRARLAPLLQRLLAWSNEHKNHFKNKVRHMIERIIRRCGYEAVEKAFPQQDMKLLQYIQKNKERARRKKKQPQPVSAEEGPVKQARKFDNEFDEALYGSSSEDESEGDADAEPERAASSRKQKGKQFILNSEDPLDLLDRNALKNVTFNRPGAQPRSRTPHTLPLRKDGRVVIGANNDEEEQESAAKDAMDAYMEAVRAGPVRTTSGKLKYLRGKRAPKEQDSDDELQDHDKNSLRPKVRGNVNKQRGGGFRKHMKKRKHL